MKSLRNNKTIKILINSLLAVLCILQTLSHPEETRAATTEYTSGSGNFTALMTGDHVITMVGGGGGGGGPANSNGVGGGGGGGGALCQVTVSLTKGASYAYVVGALGAAGTGNGGNGTSSTFTAGTTYTAGGGQGGLDNDNGGNGGTGGTATNCDLNRTGGTGATGNGTGSGGGGSAAGTTAPGNNGSIPTGGSGVSLYGGAGGDGNTANNGNGTAGSNYGGGGGGGSGRNGLAAAGAGGYIIISYADNTPPSVTPNTADANDFGTDTTPTLDFTGTDENYADDIRYNIQIDTAATFDTGNLLNKVSGTDAGFSGSPDNTDPYTSGQQVSYTVQPGEELSSGTYYWRVRGIDPSGTNTYGSYTATRSFTVSTGGDSLTGIAYTDEGTTPDTTATICAVVENGTPACDATDGSGVFLIDTLDANAGEQITFYFDGGTEFGNTVTVSDGGDIVGGDNLRVYQDHVIIRNDNAASTTILNMDAYDNDQNPTDMLFDAEDAATDTLIVEDGNELYIYTGHTFAPGGDVTVDDIEVVGTYTEASNTLTVSGTFTNSGTFSANTGTVNYDGGAQTVAAVTYNDLILSGSGAKTMTGVTTIGSLTISGTATMTSNAAFTVSGALTYSSTGSTTLAGSTNITIGSLNQSNGTIVDNGNTITVTGSSTPWTKSGGTFTTTGTTVFNANADIATLLSGTVNFNNLTFSPTLTADHAYTFGVVPTIAGNFTSNPSGAFRLTTNLSGSTVVTGTTNLTGSGSGVSTLDTVTGQNHAFTTGVLTIGAAGTLTAQNSTITINGSSGTIFSNAGTFTAGGSTVVISGSGAMSLSSATTFNDLTVTGTPTTSNNFTINGALTVSGSGNLSPSGGTVTLATTGWTISNSATLNFSGLTISETPSSQPTASFGVSGALTVNSTKTLAPTAGTITMNNGGSIVNNGGAATNLVFQGLTIASGATVTTSSSFNVAGTLTNSSTATFAPSGGTISMTTVNSSISNSGTSLVFNNLTIAETPTSQTQYNTSFNVAGALTVDSTKTLAPTSGTITMSTTGWSIVNNGSLTFSGLTISETPSSQPTASFGVSGALTVNSTKTLAPTAGTITMNNGGSIVNNGGAATNLVFQGLTIASGATVTTSSSFQVKANWTNDGTFNQSAGTVTFNGSGAQQLTGTGNNFANLSITASTARTVTITTGSVLSIGDNGNLTLQGAAGNLLTLQSDGTDWYLQLSTTNTTQSVTYVSASYSNAGGYETIVAYTDTNTDGNNNTNWSFTEPPPETDKFNFNGLDFEGININ